jgi:hypothetical protein
VVVCALGRPESQVETANEETEYRRSWWSTVGVDGVMAAADNARKLVGGKKDEDWEELTTFGGCSETTRR